MNIFLAFSDATKFADIARNIVSGAGYGGNFTFWWQGAGEVAKNGIFPAVSTPPVMPFSVAAFFKIFGVGDFAVVATSIFYYLLSLIFIYLLGKKLFNSKLVGALSTLAVGASYDIIHYATNGASESPFIFEIVAGMYFASIKKKWANIICFMLLVLMYFTRPQAFIYIGGIILYWLLNNFKTKKSMVTFGALLIAGLLIDRLILWPLSGKFFLYSVLGRGVGSSFNQSSVASDALRGGAVSASIVGSGVVQLFKNVFYNLYNFYKAIPDIYNPYFFALFVIALFIPVKDKRVSAFKWSSLFMVVVTFLVTAASIPFYRYLHPVIPLIYVLAVGTLVQIMAEMNKLQETKSQTNNKLQFSKQTILVLGSCVLVLFFGVGQTLGILILDSRFERNTHNVGKPPVYVELSKVLKENTSPDQVVVTNLDTWGSWYGERKTVWFPVEPKQIIDPATGKIPFDAIYLTSYKMDDANYYMGEGWRSIFDNPKDPSKWTCEECNEISKEFVLKGIYKVSASDDYEKQDATGILLIKNYK